MLGTTPRARGWIWPEWKGFGLSCHPLLCVHLPPPPPFGDSIAS